MGNKVARCKWEQVLLARSVELTEYDALLSHDSRGTLRLRFKCLQLGRGTICILSSSLLLLGTIPNQREAGVVSYLTSG